jgi:hydroxymethylglutaryl-CoA lyase
MIKIIECPRDAMQGLSDFIPTANKVKYINSLLKVGFDTIDFGSFVSPKAIPQLKDTEEVLSKLDLSSTSSKLLAIVANKRGAEQAIGYNEIKYIGFPFSISETFQMRNTNSTIEQSLTTVEEIQTLCHKHKKELVLYISMGFGNPYGDKWNEGIVHQWMEKLNKMEVKIIALSDTVGVANADSISRIFSNMIPEFRNIEIGAHFHTTLDAWKEKIEAAYKNGCKRFDSAIKGFGGCPMAKDDLVGNMPTENLISYFKNKNISLSIDEKAFAEATKIAIQIFPEHKLN